MISIVPKRISETFSLHTFRPVIAGEAQVELITLMRALLQQLMQGNAAIKNVISNTCVW